MEITIKEVGENEEYCAIQMEVKNCKGKTKGEVLFLLAQALINESLDNGFGKQELLDLMNKTIDATIQTRKEIEKLENE